MVEDELREFLGRVGLAGLKPVHRDTEFRCEFAERLDARCASFGFKPADVGVADTLACELALAESQLKSPPLDPVSTVAMFATKLSRLTAAPRQR